MNARIQIKYSTDSFGAKFEYPSPKLIFYKLLQIIDYVSNSTKIGVSRDMDFFRCVTSKSIFNAFLNTMFYLKLAKAFLHGAL